jgi:polyhydroxybutyrate depolymerase
MSNNFATDCKALEDQIKALEAAERRVQQNLQHAAGEDKQLFLEEIRELKSQILEKQTDFNAKRCHTVTMKWTVANAQREALVFPPATAGKHPLIFAWHGHDGSPEHAAEQMHFQTVWRDAIVVYPLGLPTIGDQDKQKAPGWQKELEPPNRDLLFFDAMLTTLREKYSVDDRRIYTAGFSNGTGFCYLLWVERGQTLAAIGAVSGVMMRSERNKPAPPRALIYIAGSEGFAPGAVDDTVQRAQEINHAPGAGQSCTVPNGAPHLTTCKLYQSTSQTPIKHITHPLGHWYPPWAPAEIVEFFKRHERP